MLPPKVKAGHTAVKQASRQKWVEGWGVGGWEDTYQVVGWIHYGGADIVIRKAERQRGGIMSQWVQCNCA